MVYTIYLHVHHFLIFCYKYMYNIHDRNIRNGFEFPTVTITIIPTCERGYGLPRQAGRSHSRYSRGKGLVE